MSLKILHLIDSGGLYGAEMMLLNLVGEQLKSGLNPLILSVGTPDVEEKQIEKEAIKRGYPLKTIRMRAGIDLGQTYRIIVFARQEGFDILHSHGYKCNILLGLFPRFIRRIPVLTTIHGYVCAKKYSKMWIYQGLDRLLIKRFEQIVFVNKHMLEQPFFRNEKYRKYSVINNGINVSNEIARLKHQKTYYPGDVIDSFISDANPLIGAISRLSPEKGLQDLLYAFRDVVRRFPQARLLVVGDGFYRKQLEEKIEELGLSDSVNLVGYSEETYYYLSRFDLFVIPSHTEGLPMVLLEAMIAEKLIIACEVGGIPEVLGQNEFGLLVEPGQPELLADRIIGICAQYMRGERFEEIRGTLRDRVQKCYSVDRMSSAYIKKYDDITHKSVIAS